MSKSHPTPIDNALYYGDNLDVLRQHLSSESVDLIYLDPPFNSAADYNVLFREHVGTQASAQIKAFKDTWLWDQTAARAFDDFVDRTVSHKAKETLLALQKLLGPSDMLAYLAMMAPRLVELHRVLKPTGSLYLHWDPTASHYLKLVLDSVFGPLQLRNEIIWKRTSAHSSAKRCGRIHDTIFFYTAGNDYTWNRQFDEQTTDRSSRHDLSKGEGGRQYRLQDLTGAGRTKGASGIPWRGFDPNSLGRHWITTVDKLDVIDTAGESYFPPDGKWPRRKKFHDESPGRAIGDVWDAIPPINASAAERLGYPAQKPVALLERIIRASSNPGDLILDPFCGCGTTVAAAQTLGRRWIGIDVTALAVTLIKNRLRGEYGPTMSKRYRVLGEPTTVEDAATLAKENPYQFQWWALGLVGARPVDEMKGADKGIDGRLDFTDDKGAAKLVVFSVKSGAHASVAMVRDLVGVVQREKAAVGVLLAMHPPTKPMAAEASAAGFYDAGPPTFTRHPVVQILTVADLLAGARVDVPLIQSNRTFKQAVRGKGKKSVNPSFPMPEGDSGA